MKNFFFYSLIATMLALPVAAAAGEHKTHAKIDCAKAENAGKKECEKHEGAAH